MRLILAMFVAMCFMVGCEKATKTEGKDVKKEAVAPVKTAPAEVKKTEAVKPEAKKVEAAKPEAKKEEVKKEVK